MTKEAPYKGPSADSEEKREPAGDIDTAMVDSLKALDPGWLIREADIGPSLKMKLFGAVAAELIQSAQHRTNTKLWELQKINASSAERIFLFRKNHMLEQSHLIVMAVLKLRISKLYLGN